MFGGYEMQALTGKLPDSNAVNVYWAVTPIAAIDTTKSACDCCYAYAETGNAQVQYARKNGVARTQFNKCTAYDPMNPSQCSTYAKNVVFNPTNSSGFCDPSLNNGLTCSTDMSNTYAVSCSSSAFSTTPIKAGDYSCQGKDIPGRPWQYIHMRLSPMASYTRTVEAYQASEIIGNIGGFISAVLNCTAMFVTLTLIAQRVCQKSEHESESQWTSSVASKNMSTSHTPHINKASASRTDLADAGESGGGL